MAKRHARENVLVRWVIDEPCWRDFAGVIGTLQRDHQIVTLKPEHTFPKEGIEIVIRDDAVFVGRESVCEYWLYGGEHWMAVHDSWLEITLSSESSIYAYVIPIPRYAWRDVKRVVNAFLIQDQEARRIQAEKDARPTLLNGLRRWVEARPMLTIVGFFVVVLPLIVLVLTLLSDAFDASSAK